MKFDVFCMLFIALGFLGSMICYEAASVGVGRPIQKSSEHEAFSSTASSDSPDFEQRQFLLGVGKETSTPNFIRLVVMRLIYGIASSMGVEERLEDAFNGAFVPPNADDGIDFGDLGGDDSDGGLLDGVFDNDII